MRTVHIRSIEQGMVLRVATRRSLLLDHRGIYNVSTRITSRGYSRSSFLGQVVDNDSTVGYLTLCDTNYNIVNIKYADIAYAYLQIRATEEALVDGKNKHGRPSQFQLVTF